MNIIIEKPQLVRAVLLYLNMNFGNLTIKNSSEYGEDFIFYVNSDNDIFIGYDKKKHAIFIRHKEIWSKINSLFHLKDRLDTKPIIKHWLEKTYNIKDIEKIYSNHSLDWTFSNAITLD
jgi:hypothetical protein